MSGTRKHMVEIITMLQHMKAGASNRQIERELGIHQRTAKKYREWAEKRELLEGEIPKLEELQEWLWQDFKQWKVPPQSVSTVEPYRKLVVKLRQQGVGVSAILERLKERGYEGSYMSVYRFVRRLAPAEKETFVRVECAPGEEAQVDFGYAGYQIDPTSRQQRRTWVFVMVLSWSRLMYVEFVFDQTVATWLRCHRHAFEFFGGVPQRLVIDNLKAGIIKACWEDPLVQMAYQECAQHYGFLISPCRPATPHHKGKVESGVKYVKNNFLAGREATLLPQLNQLGRQWCLETAGQRIHGTTKARPQERFTETEQAALQPLPETAYDLAVWKQVKLSRDCYIIFENAYYSVPHRYVGQQLMVRGGTDSVRIYTKEYQLLATHERARAAGERLTNLAHLPPEKVAGVYLDRDHCLQAAADVGTNTHEVVQQLLADPVLDRLPMVRRLLRLRERYGDRRLELACERACHFDEMTYRTIKRILEQRLEQETLTSSPPTVPPAQTFVRSAKELLGHLWSGGEA